MLQAIVNGLLFGANLALLGLGYTLVFGVMRLLTLAHGEVFMASGLLALLLSASGTPLILAGVIAVAIGAGLSIATNIVVFRPVGYGQPIAAAVATIGLALVIKNTILQARGRSTAVAVPFDVPRTDFEIGSVFFSGIQVASLVTTVVILIAASLFIRRSKWGVAMRAFSRDPQTVALMGVPIRRLTMLTLGIAGALAGLASFLLAMRNGSVSPQSGLETGILGIAIMTIGGLGSVVGAVCAGFGLGVVISLASYYGLAGWLGAVPWALLIAVLLVRPHGLAGEAES